MIRLHCTKKLTAKLSLREDGRLRSQKTGLCLVSDPATNPLGSWHANLILLQRCQCVLFVHDTTRFPVFVPALNKGDFAELDWHFQDGFMNTLLKVGAEDKHMQAAERYLAALMCDTNTDRSILGTMNQMVKDLSFMLEYDQVSVMDMPAYRAGAWLAEHPCNIKGGRDFIWPGRAMLELLEGKGHQ